MTNENRITRKQASERAGVHVRTIDYWRRTGRLTRYRDGLGHVSVDAAELDALLASTVEESRTA
jgi:predicted site-specific integrase-resolvase